MGKRWRLTLLLIACCTWGFAEEHLQVTAETVATVGDYTVKSYRRVDAEGVDYGDSSIAIERDGQPLWAKSGFRFSLGAGWDKDRKDAKWLEPGAKLLGHDWPALVIQEYSGGAHCCLTLHIFLLDREIDHIDSIDLLHGGWHFDDLDHDGCAELICHDWTFAYWGACFASSPAPTVILRKGGDGYGFVVALDLMKAAPPDDPELARRASRVHEFLGAKSDWSNVRGGGVDFTLDPIAADLWGTMLDLAYSGNIALSWQYLDRCWPEGVLGKKEFTADYSENLRRSPYWEVLSKVRGSE